jgi:hypothetical protein
MLFAVRESRACAKCVNIKEYLWLRCSSKFSPADHSIFQWFVHLVSTMLKASMSLSYRESSMAHSSFDPWSDIVCSSTEIHYSASDPTRLCMILLLGAVFLAVKQSILILYYIWTHVVSSQISNVYKLNQRHIWNCSDIVVIIFCFSCYS